VSAAGLRFSRDRRGYEHFYLVQMPHHAHSSRRRGHSPSRLLYWFRSPPNVKVGREPFDEAARRALEAGHPNVTFDWKKILATPIPSAEAERWRERRHAERAVVETTEAEEYKDAAENNDPAEINEP
jgi:hypothetical protein